MKIFISWSGDKSRSVALALRDWLPGVINSVEPFVSAKDIYAGSRWQMDIASELDATNFGIVCVTKDNQTSPWLNFEAGALAKAMESSRVVPLAVDLKPSDVELPLGQFQAQPATEKGMLDVVTSINSATAAPLPEGLLEKAFNKWWPELSEAFDEINTAVATDEAPLRTDRELLEETLNTVRSLARGLEQQEIRESRTVPRDHAVVEELTQILSEEGVESFRIMHSNSRRAVGIRSLGAIPDQARVRCTTTAQKYGVEVDYFPHRGKLQDRRPPEEGADGSDSKAS